MTNIISGGVQDSLGLRVRRRRTTTQHSAQGHAHFRRRTDRLGGRRHFPRQGQNHSEDLHRRRGETRQPQRYVACYWYLFI